MAASDARSPAAVEAPHRGSGGDVWRWVCAGPCASLVGLGLARFASTPLIPALTGAGWSTPADAVDLATAPAGGEGR